MKLVVLRCIENPSPYLFTAGKCYSAEVADHDANVLTVQDDLGHERVILRDTLTLITENNWSLLRGRASDVKRAVFEIRSLSLMGA